MCKAVDGRLHGQNKNETESPKTEETHVSFVQVFNILQKGMSCISAH